MVLHGLILSAFSSDAPPRASREPDFFLKIKTPPALTADLNPAPELTVQPTEYREWDAQEVFC